MNIPDTRSDEFMRSINKLRGDAYDAQRRLQNAHMMYLIRDMQSVCPTVARFNIEASDFMGYDILAADEVQDEAGKPLPEHVVDALDELLRGRESESLDTYISQTVELKYEVLNWNNWNAA